MKVFDVEDKLPSLYESYDFAGNSVLVSNIVNTNVDLAVYMETEYGDKGWRTVDWDSSEANRPLKGVTKWANIEKLDD